MRVFWFGLLMMLLPALAWPQEGSWKGKMIILKDTAVPFFSQEPGGPQILLGQLRHITYKVLDDRDGKLRVSQGGLEGWVAKDGMLDMDKAVAYFSAAIGQNPQVAFYYSRRAAVYRWQGDLDKALKDQDETIRLEPEEPAYFNNRGISHAGKRAFDKAIGDYDEALRLKPDYALALRNRGLAWNSKKEYDKALRDFAEALQLDPRDASAHSGRGSALAGKKQYAGAVAHFEQALRIDAQLVTALNGLAWFRATCPDGKFRNGPKAAQLARQACDLTDWKAGGVIDTLAAAHAEAGQFPEAVRFQEQALKDQNFATNNEEALRRLNLYQAGKPYRQED